MFSISLSPLNNTNISRGRRKLLYWFYYNFSKRIHHLIPNQKRWVKLAKCKFRYKKYWLTKFSDCFIFNFPKCTKERYIGRRISINTGIILFTGITNKCVRDSSKFEFEFVNLKWEKFEILHKDYTITGELI